MDVVSSGLASPRGGREGADSAVYSARSWSLSLEKASQGVSESGLDEVRVGSRRGSERGDGVCQLSSSSTATSRTSAKICPQSSLGLLNSSLAAVSVWGANRMKNFSL